MMLAGKMNFKVDVKTKEAFGDFGSLILNFIVPIVLVALSLGVFVLFVLPTYRLLPSLKSDLSSKTTEVAVLQAKVEQLKSLETNKALVVSDLVKMSWALEERDKVPELSQQVRLMGVDSGVTFSSLDYANTNRDDSGPAPQPVPSLDPDPNLYKDEKVNVSVSSKDLATLVKFLQTAENSIRLFSVDSLRISAREGVNEADLVMASPYLNPTFSAYSETSAPIDLKNSIYREFMQKLDSFKNYAQTIDATLPKI